MRLTVPEPRAQRPTPVASRPLSVAIRQSAAYAESALAAHPPPRFGPPLLPDRAGTCDRRHGPECTATAAPTRKSADVPP